MPLLAVTLLFLAAIFIIPPVYSATNQLSPEQISKKVNAHMVIGDYASACHEAVLGVQLYPSSKVIWKAHLQAVAKSGDERGMMLKWKAYIELFPEEKNDKEMMECLAWAVIDKGYLSSSPLIRVTAMLGAFFSQDAKGVAILLQGLKDENSFLRAAAVKLSSHLHDAALQDQLVKLLRTEKVWRVRLEVIQAMGMLRQAESKNDLKKIIASDHCHVEEKAAAIEALVTLSEKVDHEQLAHLVSSSHAGMRMLACEFIAYFDQPEDIDMLYPLIADPHSSVRAKLFQTIGKLRVTTLGGQSVVQLAAGAARDPDPVVAVTAAWVLTINNPSMGLPVFQQLLNHPVRETRYLASAALAATGKYGLPLATKVFREHQDTYVKMNLAFGLIGQRIDNKLACDCLYAGLMQLKERWAWTEEDNFRVLAPSKVKHDDAIPNYPEAINQLTRLEVLQTLAMVHYPYAQKAIKFFLQESHWGISGLASALLLTEGDDEAVDLVKDLLKDNDEKVKIQAALILALWGDGDDVVQILQQAYPEADRELKGQILEGLGRVGSEASLAFLTERLQEPYPTLRIISAAALLECLYH